VTAVTARNEDSAYHLTEDKVGAFLKQEERSLSSFSLSSPNGGESSKTRFDGIPEEVLWFGPGALRRLAHKERKR
jgi:hypothetical protein